MAGMVWAAMLLRTFIGVIWVVGERRYFVRSLAIRLQMEL